MSLLNEIKARSLDARKRAIKDPSATVESKALTLLVSNLNSVMKETNVETLDDAATVTVVKKSLKTVEDALSKGASGAYEQSLIIERDILNEFLPQQLSADEIRTEVQLLKEAGPVANIGAVMSHLNSKFPGRVDGKIASTIAREELN